MRTVGRFSAAAILVIVLLVTACSDNKNGAGGTRTVSTSSGNFGQGYKDGQRDAKFSLTDASGGWMWLWMTDKEYQDGYNQGWHDGRDAAKLEGQQKSRQGEEPKGGEEQSFPEL